MTIKFSADKRAVRRAYDAAVKQARDAGGAALFVRFGPPKGRGGTRGMAIEIWSRAMRDTRDRRRAETNRFFLGFVSPPTSPTPEDPT